LAPLHAKSTYSLDLNLTQPLVLPYQRAHSLWCYHTREHTASGATIPESYMYGNWICSRFFDGWMWYR